MTPTSDSIISADRTISRRLRNILCVGAVIGTVALLATPAAAQGAVKVGMLPNNPPFSMCDRPTNSNHQGAGLEVMVAVAADAGLTIELYCDFTQASLTEAVADGTVDVRISGCPDRAGTVCTDAFTTIFTGMTVPAADLTAYTSLAELSGRTVGAVTANQTENYLQASGLTDIRFYPDFNAMIAGVVAGEIAAAFSNGPAQAYRIDVLNMYPGVRFVDTFQGNRSPWEFMVRDTDMELLARINQSLAKLRANGTAEEILGRWGLELF